MWWRQWSGTLAQTIVRGYGDNVATLLVFLAVSSKTQWGTKQTNNMREKQNVFFKTQLALVGSLAQRNSVREWRRCTESSSSLLESVMVCGGSKLHTKPARREKNGKGVRSQCRIFTFPVQSCVITGESVVYTGPPLALSDVSLSHVFQRNKSRREYR